MKNYINWEVRNTPEIPPTDIKYLALDDHLQVPVVPKISNEIPMNSPEVKIYDLKIANSLKDIKITMETTFHFYELEIEKHTEISTFAFLMKNPIGEIGQFNVYNLNVQLKYFGKKSFPEKDVEDIKKFTYRIFHDNLSLTHQ